jgi:hypothetical protein
MGRRDRTPDGFRVEEWHGFAIMVDGKGVFYSTDDDGRRTEEAKTIDGLKAKINKQIKVKIPALIEAGWRDQDQMQKITVYAFTGIGAILYTRDDSPTQKEKASRWDKIWVYDEERLKKRRHFLAQKNLAERNLEKLMEAWPKVTAPNNKDAEADGALQDWGAGKQPDKPGETEPESEQ